MSDLAVQKQYSDWVYPQPIDDLDIWTKSHSQICDPAFHGPVLWPDRQPNKKFTALVAGCGTSQAAILAYTNPEAAITGIDFSAASLEQAAKLKEKHGLDNLELHMLDLHEAKTLNCKFDLVYATGVLHHLSDPSQGLRALAAVAADDGVLCLMLYAKYCRSGVEQVQEALRQLGANQTKEGIALARTLLHSLPPQHGAQPYLRGAADDLKNDACLVDTFLHAQERSYTVPQILQYAADCGLTFQGWTDNLDYYPDGALPSDHPLYPALASLSDERQWAVTELLYQFSGVHSFLLRKQGSLGDFYPDFRRPSFRDWIPARRYLLDVVEEKNITLVKRSRHVARLNGLERKLFHAVDGTAPCGALIDTHAQKPAEAERARRFFESMYRLSHLTFSRFPSFETARVLPL